MSCKCVAKIKKLIDDLREKVNQNCDDIVSLQGSNPSPNFVEVDNSFLAKAAITGDGNQPNLILTLASQRADAPWAIAGNAATYSGSPDSVRIDAMAYYSQPDSAAYQRIAPVLELLKNGTVVARSATGYQRHTASHNSSSNPIAYTDHAPGANPTYQLRAQQDSTQNDVLLIDLGHFSLEANEKLQVVGSI